MTPLRKPVFRETDTAVRDKSKRRVLVVGLVPGDVIRIRPKGTHQEYDITVEQAYRYAAKLKGDALRREKAAAKKAKRGAKCLHG